MEEEEQFIGCISCMGTSDLCDLFGSYAANVESYAKMLEICFDIKVTKELKYLCADCVEKLEIAYNFKEQTIKNIEMVQNIKDEEYLDETILEDDEESDQLKIDELQKESESGHEDDGYEEEEQPGQVDEDSNTWPTSGKLQECPLCALALTDLADHLNKCHGVKSEIEGREYPCHFCENVYSSRKACFTHLRMKHGLKIYNDQTPKAANKERKKCHLCPRDFSQKQILNKHLWKAHGIEIEKRKAFICPLCSERVSYGSHFSAHLLQIHRVQERVEQLQFNSMDDFLLYKNAIQEETKFRYRKTTASKQTIDGIRSHYMCSQSGVYVYQCQNIEVFAFAEFLLYKNAIQEETKFRFRKISASRQVIDGIRSNYMCSQSGVYVYQGKGKRPAPERQIYKTGKACPAHMIVTETMERVLVTFYKTHVGHGVCPYYEPREPKKPKLGNTLMMDDALQSEVEVKDEDDKVENSLAWICEACGMAYLDIEQFKEHIAGHAPKLYPCQYCDAVFENFESWTSHIREHSNDALY